MCKNWLQLANMTIVYDPLMGKSLNLPYLWSIVYGPIGYGPNDMGHITCGISYSNITSTKNQI